MLIISNPRRDDWIASRFSPKPEKFYMNKELIEKCSGSTDKEDFARQILAECFDACMVISWAAMASEGKLSEFERGVKTGKKLAPTDCIRAIKDRFGIND